MDLYDEGFGMIDSGEVSNDWGVEGKRTRGKDLKPRKLRRKKVCFYAKRKN